MHQKAQQIADAIKDEITQHWPSCEVEFQEGKTHPKAKLKAKGLMKSISFSSTPTNVGNSILSSLSQVRRTLRQMGAERTEPESAEADEKRYRERNDAGIAARPNPVVGEKAEARPSKNDQLASVAGAAGIDVTQAHVPATVAADPVFVEIAEEEDKPPPRRLGPGIYDDLIGDEYHADPCEMPALSSSVGKILTEYSPMHAWAAHPRLNPNFEPIDAHQFRVGRAFHTLFLGKGAPVEVLDERFKDYRTKDAKEQRDALVRAGYTPLLHEQHLAVQAQVASARAQVRPREDLAWALSGGIPERVYIWEEQTPYGPVLCKMMADWTPTRGDLAPDVKTTKAEAFSAWGQRTMWDTGCDFQDAFYRRGFAAHGIEIAGLLFMVSEVDAPHGLMCHRVDPMAQDEADQLVQHAINMWGFGIHRGKWPGYPTQTAWQSRPGWRSQNFEARKAGGLLNHERMAEQLEQAQKFADEARAAPFNDQLIEATPENPFGLPPIGGERTDQ